MVYLEVLFSQENSHSCSRHNYKRTILGGVPLLALGFGSGHDLSLWVQARVGAEAVWDSFSPSLSAPPQLVLSLSQNKF